MKNNWFKLLSFLLVVSFVKVDAQIKEQDFKASIMLTNGEQLSGFIKNETLSKMNMGLKFKSTVDGKFTILNISDFQKIELDNGESYKVLNVYLPKDTIKTNVLGSLILKGKISVYNVSYDGTEVYILEKGGENYWLQDDELKASEINMTKYFFKNILLNVIKDGGISEDEVIGMNFNEKEILAVIKKYNTYYNSASVIFKEKTEYQKFIIAGIGGNFLDKNDIEGQLNVFYRIYNPRISKSSCINMGLQYSYRKITEISKLNYKKIEPTYSSISLPVLLQQNILNKKVRPFIRVGFALSYINIKDEDMAVEAGFQQTYGIAIVYGAGLEVDIVKNFMLKSDFYKDALGHIVTAGLAYKWARK